MNVNRLARRLLTLGLCTCVVPAVVATAAPAGAADAGGSASYNCQGDSDAAPAPTPVTFALISPPTSLQPGDTLSLSGNLGITFSNADEQQSQLELTQNANVAATDFSLVVNIGDTTIKVKPSSVISTATPMKTPWTMYADVSYPDVTIPDSATGDVSIQMPAGQTEPSKVTGAPAKVTFDAEVHQDSLIFPARKFDCWADTLGDSATIAQIPLTSGPAPAGGGPAPHHAAHAGSAGAPPAPAGSTSLAGGGSAAGLLPPPGAGAAPAGAAAPAAAAPTAVQAATSQQAGAPAGAVLASAPIPPRTVSNETFVPGWILALFVALLPAAGIAFAAVQRRRLGRLKNTTLAVG